MMKPPFKAPDSAINVIRYMHCVVCGLIKLYKQLDMSSPLVQYQAYNHLTLTPAALGLGDYKPDIAFVA